MLHYLQSVSFEINLGCPLAKEHAGICPISAAGRWDGLNTSRPLTDDLILESVRILYGQLGFRGWINWHYFNDPALAFDRIEAIIPLLRQQSPAIRIGLFTNGIAIPKDQIRCKVFDAIWLKDYTHSRDWTVLRKCGVRVAYEPHPTLDDRMVCPPLGNQKSSPGKGKPGEIRCNRLFDEMIVDHYGYGHICTDDWLRKVDIGNVWEIGIRGVTEKFLAVRSQISQQPMPSDAPNHCRECGCPDKFQQCVIDGPIYQETQTWKKEHGLLWS